MFELKFCFVADAAAAAAAAVDDAVDDADVDDEPSFYEIMYYLLKLGDMLGNANALSSYYLQFTTALSTPRPRSFLAQIAHICSLSLFMHDLFVVELKLLDPQSLPE